MSFYEPGHSWESGAVHLARGIAAAPDLLIVFVHGIRTTYERTWTTLRVPEQILAAAGIDADILVLAHPSCIYHDASVEASAQMLRNRISTAFPNRTHRHVVFVTHSLGGLVVKQMLCDEAKDAFHLLRPNSLGAHDKHSLWWRTRLIINIDTPHMGGIGWLGRAYPIYAYLVRPLVHSLSWIPVFIARNAWPWGTDRQLAQLRTQCAYVTLLEDSYRHWCGAFRDAVVPSPVRLDFFASVMNTIHRNLGHKVVFDSGTSEIATVPGIDQYEKEVSGDHASALLHAIEPVGAILKTYFGDVSYLLYERTLALLLYTREIRVDRLLEPQKLMAEDLLAEARAVPYEAGAKVTVLEADAGVGKSTVVRAMARHCALSRQKYAHGPKVVLVPMHRFATKRALSSSAELWQVVLGHFVSFANDSLQGVHSLSAEWIERVLGQSHALLILDGLEEYLMNSPRVSREAALGLSNHIYHLYGHNRSLYVVITLRTSWFTRYERTRLARNSPTRLLKEPSDEELREVFPRVASVLEATLGAPDEARRLARSPLILALLQDGQVPDALQLSDWDFGTEADVYEYGLFARTKTIDVTNAVSTDALREMARLVGWEMFCRWGEAISLPQLKRLVMKRIFRWQKHIRHQGDEECAQSPAVAADLILRAEDLRGRRAAVDIVRNQVVPAVLRRTFFSAYDNVRFRPMHRELGDYLAASYLARCLQFRMFRDLGERGGTARTFRLAAQRIDRIARTQTVFTPMFVDELWDAKCIAGERSRIVFGHAAVVVANSRTACSRDFFLALIKKMRNLDELARHITFGGLCYRALHAHPHDAELRDLLIDELRCYVNCDTSLRTHVRTTSVPVEIDVFTRSMAWCYLKALVEDEALMGTMSWKDMEVSGKLEDDAARVYCGPPSVGFLDENLPLAHQVAFEQLLATFELDVHRPISVAHYLLGMAAVYRRPQHLASSLQSAIRTFFNNKDHAGYRVLVNYSKVPELRQVVDLAEQML